MSTDIVVNAALEALKLFRSPTDYLVDAFEESVKDRSAPKEIGALRAEAERRELEMRMSEAEARVAQELAIARRIETAHEVEMTEYFDYSGQGHAGVKADAQGFSAGLGGSGRKVSKRKFVFKGGPTADIDTLAASAKAETKD
ncbi:hypothetical protein D3C77_497720 [compost metagenome]